VLKSDGALESINAAKDVYWDVSDAKKIRAMATSGLTIVNLQTRMAAAAAMLREIPELASKAGDYDPNKINIENILNTALQPASAAILRPAQLGSLLTFELTVVRGAVDAGLKIAEFRKAAGDKDLNKALDTLEQFGSKLTETFHKNIAPLYGGGAVRALGTMVFLEAALALAGTGTAFAPSAMMTLSVFPKTWAGFDPEKLATSGVPGDAPAPIAAQRLVQFAEA
jgi:hypothetical protein